MILTAEEIGATVSMASNCQVLFAAAGRVLAWRDGISYAFTVDERQVRMSARIGNIGEVYDPESLEGLILPDCARRISEFLDGQFLYAETAGFTSSVDTCDGSMRLNHVLFAEGLSADALLAEFDRLGEVAKGWFVRLVDDGSKKDRAEEELPLGSEMRIEV